jgi:uncharacterized Zn-binding protein involved in type VI secretion
MTVNSFNNAEYLTDTDNTLFDNAPSAILNGSFKCYSSREQQQKAIAVGRNICLASAIGVVCVTL